MSFYDDASLIFLAGAAAGKDGKAYNVKPVPKYGPELVVNGDFATDSDWNKEASWSISGGTANYSGVSNAQITQTNLLPQSTSTTLKVQWTQTITSGTRLRFLPRNYNDSSYSATTVSVETTGDATYQGGYCYSSGTFTAIVTTTDGLSFKMVGEAGNVGSIDNVSVREVLSPAGDFTFSRGSNLSATRVGADGLIEKGRENLLLYSNQFDTTWSKQSVSVTSGQSGYNGSSDAWILESSLIGGYIRQYKSTSGVNSFSIYAKANSTDGIALRLVGITNNPYIYFDLTNGNLLFQSASIDIINVNDSESLGGGWYRFSVSYKGSLTQVRIYPSDTSTTQVIGSIYIQDAQLEKGLAATEVIESGATTGKAGLLEDEPRFDYSGGVTCPSLLLEPSRTQLVGRSEYFDSWTKYESSVGLTDQISPEGKKNVYEIIENTANNVHIVRYPYFFAANITYTISAFLKANTRSKALVAFGGNILGTPSFDYRSSLFDLSNGTIAREVTGGSSTITDFGNGWYRCSVTITTLNSGSANLDISLTDDNGNTPYQGDGTSGAYMYGAQLEQGSYPTSYIPNHSGGTITRGADILTSLNITSLVTGTPFTWFLDLNEWQGSGSNLGDLKLSNPSGAQIQLRVRVDGYRFYYNSINAGSSYPIGGSKTARKFCVKYDGSSFKLFRDGVLEDTTASVGDTGWSGLSQSAGGSTLPLDQILLFNEALSDADCTTLTGTSYDTFADMAEALNYTVYE